ncbi:CLIP-associating protein 1-like [Panonychus citri]|uniref:CLIP-associating protein 1-like n=1 Tax=Panonychus citri TaxID=50023 RepID=UPI00230801A8|nr:CLIP-associating protein 1-like [Panonychus citri]
METLLINYENAISPTNKCSSSSSSSVSTLIPEPLIGVGSSTSVNLVSGSTTTINTNNNNNQNQNKYNLTNDNQSNEKVTSLSSNCINSNSNGYNLLKKSVSLTLNSSEHDDNQQSAIITSESSSSSSTTSIKSFINNNNNLTRNTNNGLSSYRGCYSATNTPIKSINCGQLFNDYPSDLLSSCPSVRLSSPSSSPPPPPPPRSTKEKQITEINDYTPTMVSEHLSIVSPSSCYQSDHDVDSGPKSLPAYPSTLLSPTNSTSSSSSSNMMTKWDRESLYSGSGSIDDGLLTQNGSIVWDRESDWILLFDEMLKLKGTNRQGSEDCICRRKYSDSLRMKASQGITSSPSQSVSSTVSSLSSYNEIDNMNNLKLSPLKRASSLPPSRRGVSPNIRIASQLAANCPGAADEEMFIKSFEDVPMIHFGSTKELEDELSRIRDWLGGKSSDWTKRINGLKRLRSVLMSNSTDMKIFLEWFKGLELAFIPCVKDLRSQVVRETCFTIAYISQKLGLKASRFCEMLLLILISLIPNSVKIMSSSATVAIRFIIQYTRSSRFIPVIAYNMNSKSKEIRKACCEFLDQILHTWSTSSLEKHGITLQEAIRKGISDADPEARQFARKAFWGFADHFRESADSLLQSLDPSKQRILHGEAFGQQQQQQPPPPRTLSNLSKVSGRGSTGSLSQHDGPLSGRYTNNKSSSFQLPSSLSSSFTSPSIRKTSTSSLVSPVTSSLSSSYSSHYSKLPSVTNSNSTQNPPVENSSRILPNSKQQPPSYLPRIRCTLPKYQPSSSLSSFSSSSSGTYLNYGSTLRSTSAIDADAARRARTRAVAISSAIKPKVNQISSSMSNGNHDKESKELTYSPSQSVSSTVSLIPSYNDIDAKLSPLKRASSLPPSRRGVSPNIRIASQLAANCPGAADEEMFIKSFEDVPMIHFGSTKELEDELSRIRDWLGGKSSDWTKRINGLKRLRSVLMSNSTDMKIFLDWFKGLELAFIPCVKDLRSQVVRETCFTIAYISQKLGLKASRFCEMLLLILISLIPNSVKIMSSSATVAIRFIIQYTRSSRFIPVIAYNMNSKSKEIRKACCEFLDQILHTWSTSSLEKHGITLQEAIRKGISDADPEARQFARKAFWGFADHFRESADSLLQSLDPSKQRILHGEAFGQQQQQPPPPRTLSNLSKVPGRGSTGSLSSSYTYNKSPSFQLPSSLSSSFTSPSIRKTSTSSLVSPVTSSLSSSYSSHYSKLPSVTNSNSTQNPPVENSSRILPNSSNSLLLTYRESDVLFLNTRHLLLYRHPFPRQSLLPHHPLPHRQLHPHLQYQVLT